MTKALVKIDLDAPVFDGRWKKVTKGHASMPAAWQHIDEQLGTLFFTALAHATAEATGSVDKYIVLETVHFGFRVKGDDAMLPAVSLHIEPEGDQWKGKCLFHNKKVKKTVVVARLTSEYAIDLLRKIPDLLDWLEFEVTVGNMPKAYDFSPAARKRKLTAAGL